MKQFFHTLENLNHLIHLTTTSSLLHLILAILLIVLMTFRVLCNPVLFLCLQNIRRIALCEFTSITPIMLTMQTRQVGRLSPLRLDLLLMGRSLRRPQPMARLAVPRQRPALARAPWTRRPPRPLRHLQLHLLIVLIRWSHDSVITPGSLSSARTEL